MGVIYVDVRKIFRKCGAGTILIKVGVRIPLSHMEGLGECLQECVKIVEGEIEKNTKIITVCIIKQMSAPTDCPNDEEVRCHIRENVEFIDKDMM